MRIIALALLALIVAGRPEVLAEQATLPSREPASLVLRPVDASQARVGGVTLLAEGLDTPRGMVLGSAGELYIADSGWSGQRDSGRVVRIDPDGTMAPVLTGVGNGLGQPHGETYIFGLSDVAVQGESLLVVVGVGARVNDPAGPPNSLARIGPGGDVVTVFDFQRLERERDPDGLPLGSNANSVAVAADSTIWVSDAGGNWVAHLASDGSLMAVVPFPLANGEEPVPTGTAIGPDGDLYVTVPLPGSRDRKGRGRAGQAGWELGPRSIQLDQSDRSRVRSKRALYVLEFGVDYAPASGNLRRVNADGTAQLLVGGLNHATSLAVSGSGSVYITEMAGVAGGGPGTARLVRFDPAGQ